MAAESASAADAAGEALRALHPLAYYKGFLDHGVHPGPDARSIRSARPTTIAVGTIGSTDGSALAHIGDTSVLTGVTCEVGRPAPGAPRDGRLEVEVNLSPLCSSKYTLGAAPSESYALSQFLSRTVLKCGVLALSDLCIQEGESVWVLKADVVCLNHSGNIEDTALLSLMAAIQNVGLPETVVMDGTEGEADGDDDMTGAGAGSSAVPSGGTRRRHEVCIDTTKARHRVPLNASRYPVPLSFAVIDGTVVPDPTAEEEELASTRFTIVRNSAGQVCGVSKHGGDPLPQAHFDACSRMCKQRVAQIVPLFEARSSGAVGPAKR